LPSAVFPGSSDDGTPVFSHVITPGVKSRMRTRRRKGETAEAGGVAFAENAGGGRAGAHGLPGVTDGVLKKSVDS
jgi:hypothetical protein